MEPLNPWFGKAAILGIIAAIIVIRAPFGRQSRKIYYRCEPSRSARDCCPYPGMAWKHDPSAALGVYAAFRDCRISTQCSGYRNRCSHCRFRSMAFSAVAYRAWEELVNFAGFAGRTRARDVWPLPAYAAPHVHFNLLVRTWSGLGCSELDCRPREHRGFFRAVCR